MKTQWWFAHDGYLKEAPSDPDLDPLLNSEDQVRDPAADVTRITRQLWEDQGRNRQQRQLDGAELYYGCDWTGDDESGATRNALSGVGLGPSPTGFNVVQSITDTSVSRLVQNRIRPLILTENGNAEQQQQAEALQKVVEGTFWDAKFYGELGEHVCFDGHIYDAGGIKVYPDYAGRRVIMDRIDPCRFMVSARESRLGNPRSAYYYDAIDRSELLAMFRDAKPEVLQAIAKAPCAPRELNVHRTEDREEFVDDVEVFEAWHLPSSSVDRNDPTSWGINDEGEFDPNINPGHDGRRVLCIDGQTLIDEPWPFPYFPVAWFKPKRKRRSYWSRSVPEVLAGAQLMLNTMSARVDQIFHLCAVPRLIVWKNAKINTAKVTNGVGTILESSVPPSQAVYQFTPSSVPGEYLQREKEIIAWAEKQWGVNEMAMTGQKPAGIDHAPGMRHLSDELAARQTTLMHAWEDLGTTAAQLVVDCHRMLAEHCKRLGEDYSVVFGGERDLELIDWSQADLGSFVYRMKCWPTNLLPQTPGAKANVLIEWMQAGILTAEEALTQIDHPDIDSLFPGRFKRLNIEKKIASVMKDGFNESNQPHPYLELNLAKKLAGDRLNEYEAKGYPEDKLDGLRKFYEAVVSKMPPPPPAAVTPGALPPEPGAPPPPGGPGPMPPPPGPMPAPGVLQ